MALLLGIDLGTSYFKLGLFGADGALRGLGRVSVAKSSPAPGWSELSPASFWKYLREGLGEALLQAGCEVGDIAGVSYSSQASTFLLLDAHDQPITPFISWTDSRGEVAAPDAAFSGTDRFHQHIGSRGLTRQTAVTKWRWFQSHEPALWARARRIMTISDYLTFSLTGERSGDAGTAAFLGIYDLKAGGWWAEALEAFGLKAEAFSRPLLPGTPCGRTSARAAEFLGLPAGVPFAVGGLDHHVGAIGAGLGPLADVSISTGTVLAALAVVSGVVPRQGCYYGPHWDGSRFYCLAFDSAGAGQLEDYQAKFAPDHSVGQLLALAEKAPSQIGRAPAAGGAAGEHGAAVRALLEKVGMTHRRLVRNVAGEDRSGRKIMAIGGGARSPLWLQIMADILDCPIVTSASPEQGCLGAALFAAVAAKCHSSIPEALSAMVKAGASYAPTPTPVAK